MLSFPITAKLNPIKNGRFNRENVLYLAESAVLTRLLIGLVRVYQNKTGKVHDPKQSTLDKKKSFWERVFIELIGTVGYLFVLHLGQDLTAKAFEKMNHYDVNHFVQNADWFQKLKDREQVQVLRAVDQTFGPRWGRMERVLYGVGREHGNMLNALKKQMNNPKLFAKLETGMEPFVKRLNRAASMSIVGGVATSALFGGLVIQWINDRLVSPIISVLLDEFAGSSAGRPAPDGSNNIPQATTTPTNQPVQQAPNPALPSSAPWRGALR